MTTKTELENYLEGLKTPKLKALYNAIPKKERRDCSYASLSSRMGLIVSISDSVDSIENLPSQSEIEESELDLAAKKAAKPAKAKPAKTPDHICTWRAGNYGVKVTIRGIKLNVLFSETDRASVEDTRTGKAIIKGEALMTAINCQLIQNEWVEVSTSERKREISSDWWGNNSEYYTFTIYKFQNQFGETAEFWDDRQPERNHPNDPREDQFHGHPDVVRAFTWRDPAGQPIDHQWWCDTVIAYLKDNNHLVG